MKKIVVGLIVLLLTGLACQIPLSTEQQPPATPSPEAPPLPLSEKRCGDGICDGPENGETCPQDCAAAQNNPAETNPSEKTLWVTNPTSGARLFVQVLTAEDWNGSPQAALVMIPGGSGDSSHFTERPERTAKLLQAGFTLIVFDPDGRGNSEGSEDYNGYAQQDGLAAILEAVLDHPAVDPQRIGLVSYSYGVTLASGTLARYPDLPVVFLIDWEGPANRLDTGGCDENNLGHLTDFSCEDEAFWQEREAAVFMQDIQVPYQRLQSQTDHVQPDGDHALLLVNNATHTNFGGNGKSPWTRLNLLEVNAVYDPSNPPPFLSDDQDRSTTDLILQAALELFEQER